MAGLILRAPSGPEGRRPVWARPWPAGAVLAELVAGELAPRMRGRAVVELGCGLGAPGIAAARAGAEVVLTDEEAEAVELAAENARANGAAARGLVLAWGRVPEELAGAFDVALGADVTYTPAGAVSLLGAVAALLRAGGEGWIADPGRLPERALADAAARAGLAAETAYSIAPPPLPTSDGSEHQLVRVVRLTRPVR